MHLNLAHLPRPDLIKLLAGHVASSAALAAANALRCATCLRKVTPRHPRPSQQPKLGQFNDRVQTDIFFGSDAAKEKKTLIGLICCAPWYHLVASLESREPTHVSSRVCSLWSTPLGLPPTIITDLDGSFQGRLSDATNESGVTSDFMSPEAHYQLGTIERHNATWRHTFDKVVDAAAAITDERILACTTQVNSAKNMVLRRVGRSPTTAVLGRYPKLADELATDSNNLFTSPGWEPSEQAHFPVWARSEAIKAIENWTLDEEDLVNLKKAEADM